MDNKLTRKQFDVLAYLEKTPECASQREIAAALDISLGSVSRTITGMTGRMVERLYSDRGGPGGLGAVPGQARSIYCRRFWIPAGADYPEYPQASGSC